MHFLCFLEFMLWYIYLFLNDFSGLHSPLFFLQLQGVYCGIKAVFQK